MEKQKASATFEVGPIANVLLAVLQEISLARPAFQFPPQSLVGFQTPVESWGEQLTRTVYHELVSTMRGIVEDLGYDPDLLPSPPALERLLDLEKSEKSLTLFVPDISEDFKKAMEEIPGQSWDGVAKLFRVPLAYQTVNPLRVLVREQHIKVSSEAALKLRALAERISETPTLAAIATVTIADKGRVRVQFPVPAPKVADAFKRVSGFRWDGSVSAFLAPATRLREVLAIAKTQPLVYVPPETLKYAAENESPLNYDGTLDGLRGVPVSDLNSVSGTKIEKFAEFGIKTVLDLLMLIPRRYLDRSNLTLIRSLEEGQEVGLLATITKIDIDRAKRMFRVTLADSTGKITATYFNAIWMASKYRVGDEVTVYGKVDAWKGGGRNILSLNNPIIDTVGDSTLPIIPMYPQSAKTRITTWEISSAVAEAIRRLGDLTEPLPETFIETLDLMGRQEALKTIHAPETLAAADKARTRLAFDELFRMQTALLLMKAAEEKEVGIASKPTNYLTAELLSGLPYSLTGAQTRALEEIKENMISDAPMHRLLQGDVGSGKAQPLDSLVLTPTGYKRMGDMSVGDQVVNPTGEPSKVFGVYPQGKREVFKIKLSDGTSVRADGDHLWSVKTSVMRHRGHTAKIMTTRQILSDLYQKNGANKWHIDPVEPVDLDSGGERPLDPYLLGALLGDAHLGKNSIVLTSADEESILELVRLLPLDCEFAEKVTGHPLSKARKWGIRVKKSARSEFDFDEHSTKNGLVVKAYQPGYSLGEVGSDFALSPDKVRNILISEGVSRRAAFSPSNTVMTAIRNLGLAGLTSHYKFVPESYLVAPIAVRHAILQGLLDTDGTLDNQTGFNVSFSTVSDKLAQDVGWLVNSLGGRSRVTRKVRKSGLSWHVSVNLPAEFPPFRLSRKANKLTQRTKYLRPARAIVEITSDGFEEVQCIAVTHKNHLYVTDNFTTTHNTLVSLAALLMAIESGYQGALMAPTEILATQLYTELVERSTGLTRSDGTPLRVEFFSNKLRGKKREAIIADLADGSIDVAVGTHALIVGDVQFHNLGLAVIDEQHRFGVEQRAVLRNKGPMINVSGVEVQARPDMLVMTATPIPRTAAMTVFGDLDISVLDELPPGRTPIATSWKNEEPNLQDPNENPWDLIRSEVASGRQAYVVCPLVEDSEKMQAVSAVETFESLQHGALHGLRLGLVHGQMPTDERTETMNAFRDGNIDVLVATTVIEVGVNVPNATVMVILNSNRFGIAQLHQLRGRVGRGKYASYCILIGECVTSDSRARMEALVASTDGFWLSEVDLKLRGHGQVFGSSQSGQSDLRVADFDKDRDLLILAREKAIELLLEDPGLLRRPALRSEIAAVLGPQAEEWLVKS